MDLTDFRIRFPEFAEASDDLVEAKLSDALLQVSSDVFGENADAAHGLLTAHMLAISPFGRGLARPDNASEVNQYLAEFQRLGRACSGGLYRVC